MNKRIPLNDGSFINLNNDEGNFVIDKGFIAKGKPEKMLTMNMGSSIEFEAYAFDDDDEDRLDFAIPEYDPLYKHFCSLLGNNNELVINDESVTELGKKYMGIQNVLHMLNVMQ